MTSSWIPPSPGAATTPRLPPALRLGAAELIVTDLDRALAFYTGPLGLQVHRRADGEAALGAGDEDVLMLVEERSAASAGRHAGLYHVALLYPSRAELARAVARLARTRTPIQGASDHKTHEAVYLSDPDGNGLELAADRPREQWPSVQETYSGGPQPLDLEGLVAGAQETATVEPGLAVGHVHLHVGDVERALVFYRDVLGFDLIAHLGSAAFVSAGGYHHHVGLNVWRGEGVPAVPPGRVGLRAWTALLPSAEDVDAVAARAQDAGATVHREAMGGVVISDPWDIAVRFAAAP
jgi:catechol 2,3-dioxygenase